MASEGYTVRAGALASGSGQVCGLQGECQQIAGLVSAALAELAAGAGNALVESAARGVALAAIKQFLNADAGYQHTAQQLSQTAAAYAKAEGNATSSVSGVASRLAGPR
jgi:hypothetical protein